MIREILWEAFLFRKSDFTKIVRFCVRLSQFLDRGAICAARRSRLNFCFWMKSHSNFFDLVLWRPDFFRNFGIFFRNFQIGWVSWTGSKCAPRPAPGSPRQKSSTMTRPRNASKSNSTTKSKSEINNLLFINYLGLVNKSSKASIITRSSRGSL